MALNKRTKPVIFVYILAAVVFIVAFGFLLNLFQNSSSVTDEADMSDPVQSQDK